MSSSDTSRSWIITGASSGFGHALAEHVLQQGEKTLLVARRGEALEKLARHYPGQAEIFLADLTDHSQHEKITAKALKAFGRIDVLANVAGRGCVGAAEEFSDAELQGIMALNFFASVALIRAALPHMRAQKSGHILNFTSIGGLIPFASGAPYCAAKFALEGWTSSMSGEVSSFGIKVTLIEPGAFRTEFTGQALARPIQEIAAYAQIDTPLKTYFREHAGQEMGDPAKAASVILAVVRSKSPPLHLLLGSDAYAMWAQNNAIITKDMADWRKLAEDTTIDGARANSDVLIRR